MSKILATFGLLSDTHVGNSDTERANAGRMRLALERMNPYSPAGIIHCGDICDWDCISDVMVAKNIFDESAVMRNAELLITPGNHDAWCVRTDNHPEYQKYADKKNFVDYNLFADFLAPYVYHVREGSPSVSADEITKGYFHSIINGVHFLSVVGFDGHHGGEAIDWLKKRLELIRATGNKLPVLIATHVLPSQTVYSTYGQPSRWHSGTLRKLLDDYPEAVVFAGHTHAPTDRDDSFWKGSFTVINLGTLEPFGGNTHFSFGVLFVADDGEITYKRFIIDGDSNDVFELEPVVFKL